MTVVQVEVIVVQLEVMPVQVEVTVVQVEVMPVQVEVTVGCCQNIDRTAP